jgi:cytochrome c oxidase subunit 2
MPKNFPLLPPSASTLSGDVDAVYLFGVAVATVFSVLIFCAVLFLAVRFRRRSPDEHGTPERALIWLEIAWSVIPLVIMLGMFGWGAKVFFDLHRPPANATEYFVVGKQWMWKFQHPTGNREINELHVPMGSPVRLTMTSEDVIHSFYVPAFRSKSDVIPGRYSSLWFQATRTGTFPLFCAEYCGAEHSRMIGQVVVMEPRDYEAWLVRGASGQTVVASGADLFGALSCNTCHRTDSAARAPQLTGIYGREVTLADGAKVTADDNYLRESILNPAAKVVAGYQPVMPTFKGQISEEQLLQLLNYIKSLAAAPAPQQATLGGTGAR